LTAASLSGNGVQNIKMGEYTFGMVSLDNGISEVCIETYWFLSCREADGIGEQ
jgi:hypothetical protein